MNRISREKTVQILDLLKKEYPDAGCALEHRNVFELIICVVMSAQTTDVSVNKVTHRSSGRGLFDIYPDAESLASANQDDVMEIIRTIGMYKTKSANIIKLARTLCEQYDGQVPDDYDSLVALPGVGRKTANVVLSVGFGHQRIAVDTHVFRVSRRIGLAGSDGKQDAAGKSSTTGSKGNAAGRRNSAETAGTDESARSAGSSKSASAARSAKSAGAAEVLATEYELMEVIPEERWSEAHHSLIWHGRSCCTARRPKCESCPVSKLCAYVDM